MTERVQEKFGSLYSIGERRLLETSSSSGPRLNVATRTYRPTVVNRPEGTPPSIHALPLPDDTISLSEYSFSEVTANGVEEGYIRKTVAADAVERWRENQGVFRVSSPRVTLRSSRVVRNSSVSSLRTYERAPTPLTLNRRSTVTLEDGSAIDESYFEVPHALRPRVPPVLKSNQPNEWNFTSQEALINHIRSISNSSSASNKSTNPRIQFIPGISAANLPFALYPGPDKPAYAALAQALQSSPQKMAPQIAEASFSPSRKQTPRTVWPSRAIILP
jgi:hypothetical protein